MTASNHGQHKAMALDTLGNAYMYLRSTYGTLTFGAPEGRACLDAAELIDNCFSMVKAQFELIDFTQGGNR